MRYAAFFCVKTASKPPPMCSAANPASGRTPGSGEAGAGSPFMPWRRSRARTRFPPANGICHLVHAVAVQVAGRRLAVHSPAAEPADIDFLAHQALAFGPSLNARLKTMRVGVAGCGGTGSATAMLLARLGVGQIALFDDDIVDVTNLNRLHGARRADADAMRQKVEVVAREITGLGLGGCAPVAAQFPRQDGVFRHRCTTARAFGVGRSRTRPKRRHRAFDRTF